MGLRLLPIKDDQKVTYSCSPHLNAIELPWKVYIYNYRTNYHGVEHMVSFIKPCELETVWLSACLCMCAKARGQLWLSFLWWHSPFIFETGVCHQPGSHQISYPVWPVCPKDPQYWDYKYTTICSFFTWVLRFELRYAGWAMSPGCINFSNQTNVMKSWFASIK